jgi:hypothetical protein
MAYDSRRVDFSSKEGAERLAEAVRQYWARRGYTVDLAIEEVARDHVKKPVFSIKSDLLAGRPRKPCP